MEGIGNRQPYRGIGPVEVCTETVARVGVRRGTTAEEHVRTDGTAGSIVLSESNEELYSALSESRIDAVIDDSPIARYFARIVQGLRFAGIVPGSEGGYAIVLKKGNARLREILDTVITGLEADGTLQQIWKRWFAEEGPEVNATFPPAL